MIHLQCVLLRKVNILCHAGFCSKCWEKLLFASEVYMCCSDVVVCGSSTVCLEFCFKQLPDNTKWKTSISLIIKINIRVLTKVLKWKMSVVKMFHPKACLLSRSCIFTLSDATTTKAEFFNVCYLEHLLFISCAT